MNCLLLLLLLIIIVICFVKGKESLTSKYKCDTSAWKCVADPNGKYDTTTACITDCYKRYKCNPKTGTCDEVTDMTAPSFKNCSDVCAPRCVCDPATGGCTPTDNVNAPKCSDCNNTCKAHAICDYAMGQCMPSGNVADPLMSDCATSCVKHCACNTTNKTCTPSGDKNDPTCDVCNVTCHQETFYCQMDPYGKNPRCMLDSNPPFGTVPVTNAECGKYCNLVYLQNNNLYWQKCDGQWWVNSTPFDCNDLTGATKTTNLLRVDAGLMDPEPIVMDSIYDPGILGAVSYSPRLWGIHSGYLYTTFKATLNQGKTPVIWDLVPTSYGVVHVVEDYEHKILMIIVTHTQSTSKYTTNTDYPYLVADTTNLYLQGLSGTSFMNPRWFQWEVITGITFYNYNPLTPPGDMEPTSLLYLSKTQVPKTGDPPGIWVILAGNYSNGITVFIRGYYDRTKKIFIETDHQVNI